MVKLTEYDRMPPGADHKPPMNAETFGIDESALPPTDPRQQRAATRQVYALLGVGPEAREVLSALFGGTPKRRSRPVRPARAGRAADPALSQHPPGDIRPWRVQACEWGRDNGWPDARSDKPLDPDLNDAYRAWLAAHPEVAP